MTHANKFHRSAWLPDSGVDPLLRSGLGRLAAVGVISALLWTVLFRVFDAS